MTAEDERAALYRSQAEARVRNKRLAEKALAGNPVTRRELAEKTKALLEVDENGVLRSYVPLDPR